MKAGRARQARGVHEVEVECSGAHPFLISWLTEQNRLMRHEAVRVYMISNAMDWGGGVGALLWDFCGLEFGSNTLCTQGL